MKLTLNSCSPPPLPPQKNNNNNNQINALLKQIKTLFIVITICTLHLHNNLIHSKYLLIPPSPSSKFLLKLQYL